ncbi:MAG: hypothetical protein HY365_03650 [Candidatus Aenigmarchaeota archaeon]|nr:hypothetical protein [Candidatus Aenigmarchaeota archaeon]
MKGNHAYFVMLSVLGIMVGLFLVFMGVNGTGLNPMLTLIVGIFMTIKEILDVFH